MKCPFCASGNSRVIDTRSAEGGIRRRRECEDCDRRFTTYERVAPLRLMVVKRDGRREPFDRDKILDGIQIACAKRPIGTGSIEELVSGIESELYHRGSREVTSREIGEMVMQNLRRLDEVAYIRFGTIYRRFADVEDLADEIEGLLERRQREAVSKAQLRLEI
ncbi:transcriptional regulator NrdR [Chloroflexota bacterium]